MLSRPIDTYIHTYPNTHVDLCTDTVSDRLVDTYTRPQQNTYLVADLDEVALLEAVALAHQLLPVLDACVYTYVCVPIDPQMVSPALD